MAEPRFASQAGPLLRFINSTGTSKRHSWPQHASRQHPKQSSVLPRLPDVLWTQTSSHMLHHHDCLALPDEKLDLPRLQRSEKLAPAGQKKRWSTRWSYSPNHSPRRCRHNLSNRPRNLQSAWISRLQLLQDSADREEHSEDVQHESGKHRSLWKDQRPSIVALLSQDSNHWRRSRRENKHIL